MASALLALLNMTAMTPKMQFRCVLCVTAALMCCACAVYYKWASGEVQDYDYEEKEEDVDEKSPLISTERQASVA